MKIFKIIYSIVIAFIVLIAVLLIISILPLTGNFKTLVVLSGSMEPAIHTGSVVLVKPAGDYKIGDIITFGKIGKNQTPTTHRIFDIRVLGGEPVYVTKGDANNAPDSREIQQKDIIGKALFSVPFLGYVVDFAKKPFGFLLIIIVPALAIIFDEIKKIIKETKKMRQKKEVFNNKEIKEEKSG